MARFYEIEPSLQNFWRGIILFGRNSASYKFALARSLIDLSAEGKTVITLQELAVPYTQHLCEHLKHHPKQVLSANSTFLAKLKEFNEGLLSQDVAL